MTAGNKQQLPVLETLHINQPLIPGEGLEHFALEQRSAEYWVMMFKFMTRGNKSRKCKTA